MSAPFDLFVARLVLATNPWRQNVGIHKHARADMGRAHFRKLSSMLLLYIFLIVETNDWTYVSSGRSAACACE